MVAYYFTVHALVYLAYLRKYGLFKVITWVVIRFRIMASTTLLKLL